jgi:hypothetical protein
MAATNAPLGMPLALMHPSSQSPRGPLRRIQISHSENPRLLAVCVGRQVSAPPRQWSLTAHVNEACSFCSPHPRDVKSRLLLGALAIEWERLELVGAKGPYDRHGYPLFQCCTARDNARGVRDLPCSHPLIEKTLGRSNLLFSSVRSIRQPPLGKVAVLVLPSTHSPSLVFAGDVALAGPLGLPPDYTEFPSFQGQPHVHASKKTPHPASHCGSSFRHALLICRLPI